MAGRKFKVPSRRQPLFDYRRPCDRCSWDGWLRSELQREPQTNLLVCEPCLDLPREDLEPERLKLFNRQKIID